MTLESSPWQIDGNRARVQAGLLQAQIDLRHPRAGLLDVVYDEFSMNHLHPLQVRREPSTQGQDTLVESYVRGHDLVATYAPTPPHTARSVIYWRALDFPNRLAGVELLISMQTDQLSSDPRVSNRTVVDASEAWWLTGDERPRFEQLYLSGSPPWTTAGRAAGGAFLFRMSPQDVSYLEIVSPADFEQAELCVEEGAPGAVQLGYGLFPDRLEKGVIRTVRVRGLLLPSENDQAIAHACCLQMFGASPPLTT